MDTGKLKIGFVLIGKDGEPVRTGRRGAQTSKLYAHAGTARRVASGFFHKPLVSEAYIEAPTE